MRKLLHSIWSRQQKEEVDPTPVALPSRAPLTLREQVQLYIREELSAQAEREGQPSFEEEDDFEEDDSDEFGLSRFQVMSTEADPGFQELEGNDNPPAQETPPEKRSETAPAD